MKTVHNEHEAILHYLREDTPVICDHDGFTHTANGFHNAAAWFREMERTPKPAKIVSNPVPQTWYNVKRDGLPPPDQKVMDANVVTYNRDFRRTVYMDEWTGSKFASGQGVTDWMIISEPGKGHGQGNGSAHDMP